MEDTVTMLVQTYTRSNCGPVVLDILRNMNFNQLALDLEKSFSCGKLLVLLLFKTYFAWEEVTCYVGPDQVLEVQTFTQQQY